MLQTLIRYGVNFTNVLQAAFSYKIVLSSFFALKAEVCIILEKGNWRKSCLQNVGEIDYRMGLLMFSAPTQEFGWDGISKTMKVVSNIDSFFCLKVVCTKKLNLDCNKDLILFLIPDSMNFFSFSNCQNLSMKMIECARDCYIPW